MVHHDPDAAASKAQLARLSVAECTSTKHKVQMLPHHAFILFRLANSAGPKMSLTNAATTCMHLVLA